MGSHEDGELIEACKEGRKKSPLDRRWGGVPAEGHYCDQLKG